MAINQINKFMISRDPISNHSSLAQYSPSVGTPIISSNFGNITEDRYKTADYIYSGTNGSIGIKISQAVSRALDVLIFENLTMENQDNFNLKIMGSDIDDINTANTVYNGSGYIKNDHNCYFIKYDTASYKYFWVELIGFTGNVYIGMIWWDIFYEFERNPTAFHEKIIDYKISNISGAGIIYKVEINSKHAISFALKSINGTFLSKLKNEIFAFSSNFYNYWILYPDENGDIVFRKYALKNPIDWAHIVKYDFSINLNFEESLI